MPRVSVIIPNYNHASFLKQRIDSVLIQTFSDFEVIILDDCSTDNSRDVIEDFRNNNRITHIVYNAHNSGSPFKQWKTGMELATGDYIWIAESDDLAENNLLEELMKPFDLYPDVIVSSCRSIVIDDNNKHLGLQASSDELNATKWQHSYVEDAYVELKNYLQFMCTLPNASAVVFKKPTSIGKVLDTNMRFAGDWLFWKNLLKNTGKIAYTNKTLNYFRRHNQTTRSVKNINPASERIRYKELNSFVPSFFINIFEKRYDWIIRDWAVRKNGFKNSISYYTTLLHPALAVRYYMKCIRRLVKSSR